MATRQTRHTGNDDRDQELDAVETNGKNDALEKSAQSQTKSCEACEESMLTPAIHALMV